jgi:tripartite-type tricarboxylate transporter receptor subunit TctC
MRGAVVTSVLLALGAPAPALAQTNYPERTIKIINPFSAGSPVDFVGRLVASKLEAAWHQPVVVEVRNGAGGTIGASFVVKSPPDGYTLMVTSASAITSAPVLVKGLPYDPIKDLTPIWAVHSGGLVVVVNPALPVKTLAEFVRHVRERPGRLSFASSGFGTSQHLAGELFMARTGIRLVHVPYRGGPAGSTDLIAGHVQVMFDSLSNTYQAIQAGKLRALALLRPKTAAYCPSCPPQRKPAFRESTWSAFSACSVPPACRSRCSTSSSARLGPR